jgi:hypothetical protein
MHLNNLNNDQTYFVILSVSGRETFWVLGRDLKKNWRSSKIQKFGLSSPLLPGYSYVECGTDGEDIYIGCRAFRDEPQIAESAGARYVSTSMETTSCDHGHVMVPFPGTAPKTRKPRIPLVEVIPDTGPVVDVVGCLREAAVNLSATLCPK